MDIWYYPSCKIEGMLTPQLAEIFIKKCFELNVEYVECSSFTVDNFYTQELPNKKLIYDVFAQYEPKEMAINFELIGSQYSVGFLIRQEADNKCYVSIGGCLVDIERNMPMSLGMLLHVTSPFILTDLTITSDLEYFDKHPEKALPGITVLLNDYGSNSVQDQISLAGFEFFASPESAEPYFCRNNGINYTIYNVQSGEMYIKQWLYDTKSYSEHPVALLKINHKNIFTIVPLKPYMTKEYEDQIGFDLGYYAKILYHIAAACGLEEIKYIPVFKEPIQEVNLSPKTATTIFIRHYPSCKIQTQLTAQLVQTIFEKCKELNLTYLCLQINENTTIEESLTEEKIAQLFELYKPHSVTLNFLHHDKKSTVNFTIQQDNTEQCSIALSGDVLNIDKEFFIKARKNTIVPLEMLLRIASPFALIDLAMVSNYEYFDRYPDRALPGLNAWIKNIDDSSSFVSTMTEIELSLRGFGLFESPTSTEPGFYASGNIEYGIGGDELTKLYIKEQRDRNAYPKEYIESPIAMLKIYNDVFTIVPLEPYTTKEYEGKTILNLEFYTQLLLHIINYSGVDEIKYVPISISTI